MNVVLDYNENLKKNVLSTDNLKKIINILETKLNKKLNKTELSNVLIFIKELNYKKLYQTYKNDFDKINEYISTMYNIDVNRDKMPFDMHEFLKKEIADRANVKGTTEYKFTTVIPAKGNNNTNNNDIIKQEQKQNDGLTKQDLIQIIELINKNNKGSTANGSTNGSSNGNIPSNLMNVRDQIELTKILNYESLWRDSNILVDSRYQSIANRDRSKMVFNIISKTRNKTPGSGAISSISSIRDIVELEIFPFSIPYIPAADNYYQKITMSILELSSISIDAYEDSQFHFMFKAQIVGNLIELTPINKIFRFFKPITRLNEFSIRFGSPLNPITFDKDRLFTASFNYATNPGVIIFSESHNLITGDIIYINDFTTNSPAVDLNVINEINNPQGHLCTRISNTSISINVDFTQITNPNLSLSVEVYLGSKRIIMPLRIRYLYGETDN